MDVFTLLPITSLPSLATFSFDEVVTLPEVEGL